MDIVKKCYKCEIEKTLDKFYKHNKGKYNRYSICIECCKIRDRKKYHENPNIQKENQKRFYLKYPEARRKALLKSKFKITIEEYNNILNNQNNCCAICKKHKSEFKRNFDVDHCHETNKIRGLLCNQCNQALGLFKDNINYLNEAIKYLNIHYNANFIKF